MTSCSFHLRRISKKYGMTQSLHLPSSAKEYHKETEKRNARVPSIRFVFVLIVSVVSAFLFLVSSSRSVSFEQKAAKRVHVKKLTTFKGSGGKTWRSGVVGKKCAGGCEGTFLRGGGGVDRAKAVDSMRGIWPIKNAPTGGSTRK